MNTLKLSFLAAVASTTLVLAMDRCAVAELVGHWKFDGDLTDRVGGNDGTSVGDAAAGTNNGMIGGAVSFDGDADAVTISPDVIVNAAFSIAFWEFSVGDANTGYFLASGNGDGWEDLFFRRFGDGLDYAGGITQVNGTAGGYTFGEALGDGLSRSGCPPWPRCWMRQKGTCW